MASLRQEQRAGFRDRYKHRFVSGFQKDRIPDGDLVAEKGKRVTLFPAAPESQESVMYRLIQETWQE